MFCSRPEFEVLYGGAAGGGKSECLVMEATRHISFPDYRALLLRRTFPQLQEIIDRCFRWYTAIDPGAFYKVTEHRWYFSTGATIQLGHMQHEKDKYNFQGKEFHFIGLDEVTQFLESQYTYIFSRCRSTNPQIPCRIRSTANPGGPGHAFVYERFNIRDKDRWGFPSKDKKTGLSKIFIPAKLADNPTLAEADPDYVRRLMALPEIERKRLLDGNWDYAEGVTFSDLQSEYHGCSDFPLPPEWEYFSVFDWGYSKPWVYQVFAVDFNDVLYLVAEHYGAKEGVADEGVRQTNDEMCVVIRDMEKNLRVKIKRRIADPACWSPTKKHGSNQMHGPSFVDDAAKHGLFFLKADNARAHGKQQVHMRLQLDENTDKETGEMEYTPRFMAFKSCHNFWRTMPLLQNSKSNPEDVDTDQEDHSYDTFRYACMSRPVKPKIAPIVIPGSFQHERKKMINARKYAERHGVSMATAYGRVR
jgi:hypothetical protein